MTKKLEIKAQETIEEMIDSLEDHAEKRGIDLTNKIPDNPNSLDDVFKDGGEARCEYFGDLSFKYALQFGQFESLSFMDAHYKSMVSALKKMQKKWNGKGE